MYLPVLCVWVCLKTPYCLELYLYHVLATFQLTVLELVLHIFKGFSQTKEWPLFFTRVCQCETYLGLSVLCVCFMFFKMFYFQTYLKHRFIIIILFYHLSICRFGNSCQHLIFHCSSLVPFPSKLQHWTHPDCFVLYQMLYVDDISLIFINISV